MEYSNTSLHEFYFNQRQIFFSLSLSPAYPPYFLALRANPGNKAKKGNPDCNGEMEKQLRNQRLNSEFSSQSIPRKPRTISNVDNSLAVPYLSPQSGVKRLLG